MLAQFYCSQNSKKIKVIGKHTADVPQVSTVGEIIYIYFRLLYFLTQIVYQRLITFINSFSMLIIRTIHLRMLHKDFKKYQLFMYTHIYVIYHKIINKFCENNSTYL